LLSGFGLAGCLELPLDGGSGDSGPPDFASTLYDPSAVISPKYSVFGRVKTDHLSKNEDSLPEQYWTRLERMVEGFGGVDLDSVDTATGITSRDPDRNVAGGAMSVSGQFDPDGIETTVEARFQTEYDRSTTDGVSIYTVDRGQMDYGDYVRTNTVTVGASEDRLFVGGMQAPKATSGDAVRKMIAAEKGDGSRLCDAHDGANELLSRIGRAPIAGGVSFDSPLDESATGSLPDDVAPVAENLVSIGLESEIDGDTTNHTVGLTYADTDTPSKATVQTAIDSSSSKINNFDCVFHDVSITTENRTVLVSATGTTESVFELLGFFWFPASGP
jgi:hypothetical protein